MLDSMFKWLKKLWGHKEPALTCGIPPALTWKKKGCNRPAVLVVKMRFDTLVMCDRHNPFKDNPDFADYLKSMGYKVIPVEEAIVEAVMSE